MSYNLAAANQHQKAKKKNTHNLKASKNRNRVLDSRKYISSQDGKHRANRQKPKKNVQKPAIINVRGNNSQQVKNTGEHAKYVRGNKSQQAKKASKKYKEYQKLMNVGRYKSQQTKSHIKINK